MYLRAAVWINVLDSDYKMEYVALRDKNQGHTEIV
jgi:hypothetical protein